MLQSFYSRKSLIHNFWRRRGMERPHVIAAPPSLAVLRKRLKTFLFLRLTLFYILVSYTPVDLVITLLLGPFHGTIAVPSVTHCRCRCRRRGHPCAGGVRQ